MSDKVYPIGTKIRYKGSDGIFSKELFGMTGEIVGIVRDYPLIYLPAANFVSEYSTKERPATVQTNWKNIEVLPQKNRQLLFAFMEE